MKALLEMLARCRVGRGEPGGPLGFPFGGGGFVTDECLRVVGGCLVVLSARRTA